MDVECEQALKVGLAHVRAVEAQQNALRQAHGRMAATCKATMLAAS